MAQLVKFFLYKPESLSSDPQDCPCKEPGTKVARALGRQTGGSLGPTAGGLPESASSTCSESFCFKN